MRYSRENRLSGRPGSNRRPPAWECDPGQFAEVSPSANKYGTSRENRGLEGEACSPEFARVSRAMFPFCSLGSVAIVALGALGATSATASAAPSAPCAKHVGEKRVACLKYRARQPYPSRATWADFRSRATPYEYDTLHRIARCEMGDGPRVKGSPWRVRFGLVLPRYSSAFGIWNGNFTYTRAATGYDWPTSVPAEEAFHALALARRYGFSAWSCF